MEYAEHLNLNGGMDQSDSSAQPVSKLFVGQIPKDVNEEMLASFFQEFGSVKEVSIIRDSTSGISRGCAFVTYHDNAAAIAAVDALHDKRKLPNAMNFLQVRFAETQIEKENKLFVGMVPKTFTEHELSMLFQPFGELKEVHIIRGPEGSPKGCAFIKFQDRESAMAALTQLNETIPPGGTRQLVVKFAEGKKGGHKEHAGFGGNNFMKNDGWFGNQHNPQLGGQFMVDPNSNGAGRTMFSPYSMPNPAVPALGPGAMMPFQMRPPVSGQPFNMNDPSRGGPVPGMPQMGYGSMPPGFNPGHGMQKPFREMQNPAVDMNRGFPVPGGADMAHHQRPPEGPSGANLFIYHLPRDLSDADLATLFAPFGNVISAKVFVDKKTSDSKGFGFVSYDSYDSANSAIESMNGFQIGSKRLKVQHKRTGVPGMEGPMMGKEQDNQFPRNMMMHNLANVPLNPMMAKMGGHEMPPAGLAQAQYGGNPRFDYAAAPTMPPQFQMMPPALAQQTRSPYHQNLPEMEGFNLHEYMPGTHGGVKHL